MTNVHQLMYVDVPSNSPEMYELPILSLSFTASFVSANK